MEEDEGAVLGEEGGCRGFIGQEGPIDRKRYLFIGRGESLFGGQQ